MTVRNTSLTDRLAAVAKAKQAMAELFKPKAAAPDPASDQRQAGREAARDAKAAARQARK